MILLWPAPAWLVARALVSEDRINMFTDQLQSLLLFHALRPDRAYFTPEDAAEDLRQTRRLSAALPVLKLVITQPQAISAASSITQDAADLKRAA